MQDAIHKSVLSNAVDSFIQEKKITQEYADLLKKMIENEEYDALDDAFTSINSLRNLDSLSDKGFRKKRIIRRSYEQPSEEKKLKDEVLFHKQQIENLSEEINNLNKRSAALQAEINHYKSGYKKEIDKNKDIEEIITNLQNRYKNTLNEYEKLKSQLQHKRIEDEIPDYVSDVSKKLDDDDSLFMRKSQRWSVTGIIFASLSVCTALYTFKTGLPSILNPNISFLTAIFIFFRGLIAIGILSWVSYICFQMSSSYIHESILRKDRQHALSFGRLFLQIYGDTATKAEAIEVFKDWNMTGNSAFSKSVSNPPNINELIKTLKGLLQQKNNDNTEK
ncbi:hypothetical protein ACUNDQ_04550 [Pectobacterium brasiliense]|uniref:hypothetical protein n=1 Tax=Pectobacterium brasiliense TaxID=180957 RepID=UPI004043AAA0